jgi:hypothetical protein
MIIHIQAHIGAIDPEDEQPEQAELTDVNARLPQMKSSNPPLAKDRAEILNLSRQQKMARSAHAWSRTAAASRAPRCTRSKAASRSPATWSTWPTGYLAT